MKLGSGAPVAPPNFFPSVGSAAPCEGTHIGRGQHSPHEYDTEGNVQA